MTKQTLENELVPIERQIAANPQGISISELESALAALGIVINRRTLLRRLTVLIQRKRITATGVLKGRLYRPVGTILPDGVSAEESEIPLSDAGNEICSYVYQPIQRREPVGCQRDFLFSYPENGPYFRI